jgi:2-hydroxychromene-2-carboxylate isomerase
MVSCDFYFGPGSRYSYLASTQLAKLAEETGVVLRWRPVLSMDLIARDGANPFASGQRRGQYSEEYRARDTARWAQHYGVPFKDPGENFDWRKIAMWCVAADLAGKGEAFARWSYHQTFALGQPPQRDDAFQDGAAQLGLDPALLRSSVESGAAQKAHDRTVAMAADAGAFGVPSFVVDDGEIFWGQDRLPLLRDHLLRRTRR